MSDASPAAATAGAASDTVMQPPLAMPSSLNGHAPMDASQQASSSSSSVTVASSSASKVAAAQPSSSAYGKTSDPPSDAGSTSTETRAAGTTARPSRRVMPARLLRVSSLLVGSKVEDELLGGIEGRVDTSFLPAQTSIFLSSSSAAAAQAYEAQSAQAAGLSFFSDPEVARSCRQRELIETPEFSNWDDSEMLGKTRHMKSEEDTSDAAYEKRHRRPDKVEKRQRRLEKELLMRDRQKLKERIEHLKVADTRLLLPIIAARERAENGTSTADVDAHSSAMTAKLEQLRANLLAEAYDTLARYDALLPPAAPLSNATELKKRLHADDDSDSDGVRSSPGPASGSAASAAKRFSANFRAGAAASPLGTRFSSSKAARPSRASSGMLFTPKQQRIAKARSSAPSGPLITTPEGIRVELGHHNIHARTSGGRFAPKSAVQKLADKAAKEAKRLGLPPPNIGTPVITTRPAPPVAQPRRSLPARGLSPDVGVATLVPGKRGFKIRRDRQPEASGSGSRVSTTQSTGAAGAGAGTGQGKPGQTRDYHGRFSAPSISAEQHLQKAAANKTGPSLAELDAAERRPKRVKLILRGREGAAAAATPDPVVPATSTAQGTPLTAANVAALEENEEPTVDSTFSMGDGLTFEQAQAMMEAAMMGDGEEGGAGADAPADVAAPEASSSAAQVSTRVEEPAPKIEEAEPAASVPKIEVQEEAPAAPSPAPAAASTPAPAVSSSTPASPAPAPPTPSTTLKPKASGSTSRRTSSRVQNASAFGEKIPEHATRRVDFDIVWADEVVHTAGELRDAWEARMAKQSEEMAAAVAASASAEAQTGAQVEQTQTAE